MSSSSSPGIGDYIYVSSIGQGSSSTVMKALHFVEKRYVAIKIVDKTKLHPDRIHREFEITRKMNHPFIVKLLEYLEDNSSAYFVMELIQGPSLLDTILKCGTMAEPHIKHYLIELLLVIKYLHKEIHVAHRDLKLENILVDQSHHIRLIDFGLSNMFTDTSPGLTTGCGSLQYTAPEVLLGHPYSPIVDIWSLGVIIYSMAYGHLPFDDSNVQKLMYMITNEEPEHNGSISTALEDLISRMLTKNPNERITIEELANSPFLLSTYGLYEAQINQWETLISDDSDPSARVMQRQRLNELLKVVLSEYNPQMKKISSLKSNPYSALLAKKGGRGSLKASGTNRGSFRKPHLTF